MRGTITHPKFQNQTGFEQWESKGLKVSFAYYAKFPNMTGQEIAKSAELLWQYWHKTDKMYLHYFATGFRFGAYCLAKTRKIDS